MMTMENINANVAGRGKSPTLGTNELSAAMEAEGREVFRFGFGESPFPVPDVVAEALRQNAHQKSYLPVQGLPELREAVAQFHGRREGLGLTVEQVMIGPGSKELMFLLQLCLDAEVLVPTPCWVSYVPHGEILGRPVRLIHTTSDERWLLSAERLAEEAPDATPRLLILNYPGNPQGTTYSQQELEALADVAREKNIIIMSDEIYGELHHDGGHQSLVRYYPEGTIISSGLSKWCGAGGWRLGTFVFPEELSWLREAMCSVASETYSTVSAPIQYAAVSAYSGGEEMESYLSASRRIIKAAGNWAAHRLNEAGVAVHHPEGAFYLFLDFSTMAPAIAQMGIETSSVLCEKLLEETGVVLLSGEAFSRPPEELTARLAYVTFDGGEALKAVGGSVDDSFLGKYCPKVVEGIDRLTKWAEALSG